MQSFASMRRHGGEAGLIPPTLKDVSQLAGVSQSTVSRVLSGADTIVPIAPETRDRVMRAAETLRYRPHPLARGLRGAGTALLGLIVRDIADPFFTAMLKVIAQEARRRGYNVVLGDARSSAEEAQALTQILEVRHCEAILLVGDVADEPRLLADLTGTHMTLVGLCQGTRAPGLLTVNADGARGARLALDHLYALGHRRIALIDAGWIGDAEPRRAAYRQFVREHDLYSPAAYQQVVPNDPGGGQTACNRLLRLRVPPTAIFATTDVLALGALNAAHASGRRVPEDLSLVGFDDIPLAAYAVPPLTTVRQPVEAMARLAIDLVLRRDGEPASERETYSLEPELIVRKSTTSTGPERR
ncbi:MAG: LacI family DNA-binding transcriptional regulator [Chloroflexi bacterium]|nr:LacI family DNA-binding transcriptional regulator [Chloroflexota bacterium]